MFLNICRGNTQGSDIINRGEQRVIKGSKVSIFIQTGKTTVPLDFKKLCICNIILVSTKKLCQEIY